MLLWRHGRQSLEDVEEEKEVVMIRTLPIIPNIYNSDPILPRGPDASTTPLLDQVYTSFSTGGKNKGQF